MSEHPDAHAREGEDHEVCPEHGATIQTRTLPHACAICGRPARKPPMCPYCGEPRLPPRRGEVDPCLSAAARNAQEILRLEAEVDRLHGALEAIRRHAEGQVTQYARAREQVARLAREALEAGER
jgi:hypothetical protein